MRIIRNFVAIFILSFVFTSCNKFSKIEKSKDIDYKLTKADEYYAKKKYKYAQQLYEELFPAFKGNQKFEDLYYKYAYCFYYDGQYKDAENLFKGYLETFPNSTRAEEVDYIRCYCFYKESPKLELEQVNTVKAMNLMQSFINTHPGSSRIKDANDVIDKCRLKLEEKDERAAHLYYNLTQYRAAGLAYASLLNNYSESPKGEEYKLMVVKSYYKFAKLSYETKQIERYEKVTTEYEDFLDRYPESKLLKEAGEYSNLSKNHIKDIQNEQITASAK